jgi:hypothetical protein
LQRFDISMPIDRAGFGERLRYSSSISDWQKVLPQYRSGNSVEVPEWLFEETGRVPDRSIWKVDADLTLLPTDRPAVEPESIVIALESPHKAEFKTEHREPLMHAATRARLKRGLSIILPALADRFGVAIPGRQVVLANAIQYQTSLSSILPPGSLRTALRDEVFLKVFEAGAGAIFLRRLADYRPALLLLTPTAGVSAKVQETVLSISPPWPLVTTSHPYSWAQGCSLSSTAWPAPLRYRPGSSRLEEVALPDSRAYRR